MKYLLFSNFTLYISKSILVFVYFETEYCYAVHSGLKQLSYIRLPHTGIIDTYHQACNQRQLNGVLDLIENSFQCKMTHQSLSLWSIPFSVPLKEFLTILGPLHFRINFIISLSLNVNILFAFATFY